MVIAKVIRLARPFDGEPKSDNFSVLEEELPPLKKGEVLVEALYWSVDPYQRIRMVRFPPNSVMIGSQVSKIIESQNPKFPVGKLVVGYFGWRTHTIFDDSTSFPYAKFEVRPYILPDFGSLPLSLGLGVLGMPGNTAYFGFHEILRPNPGETLVVSGAAGAVGSLVGQLGKAEGLRVIGIAGSEEKGRWLVSELGFDAAINYKTQNIQEELKRLAPEGVDLYFDNVGGSISSDVIHQMRPKGRIAVCGSVSAYNGSIGEVPRAPTVSRCFINNRLQMEGFLVFRWLDRWTEGIEAMARLVSGGKVKYEETLTKGFENMPDAFIGMLRGENKGKAVVEA